MIWRALLFQIFIFYPLSVFASDDICLFRDTGGQWHLVEGQRQVPLKQRKEADCRPRDKLLAMADPGDIDLQGPRREHKFLSRFGQVHVRWPRSVESHFSKSPLRVVTSSFKTVEKVLQQNSFSHHVQRLNTYWEIVFLNRELSRGQLPVMMVSSCHPAWMVPPAKIYIVAPRVAEGCRGNRLSPAKADERLDEVVLHEIGHVLEYVMLKGDQARDRRRSEGFATWFELFAASYSPDLNAREIAARYDSILSRSESFDPFTFPFYGTEADYIRASSIFQALVDKRGVQALSTIYSEMTGKKISFKESLQSVTGWSDSSIRKEMQLVRFSTR